MRHAERKERLQISKAAGQPMAWPEDETARMIVESREKPGQDISMIKYAAEERGREEAQLAFTRKLLRIGRPIGEIMDGDRTSRGRNPGISNLQ